MKSIKERNLPDVLLCADGTEEALPNMSKFSVAMCLLDKVKSWM